jgi:hypothetical protein
LGFEKHNAVISPDAIDNNRFSDLAENITKKNAREKLGLDQEKYVFLYFYGLLY